jgi:hypothetical protein
MSSVFFAKSLRIFCAEPAERRAPAGSSWAKIWLLQSSGDGALMTPRQGAQGECGVVTCDGRPIGKANEKARGGFLRAGSKRLLR